MVAFCKIIFSFMKDCSLLGMPRGSKAQTFCRTCEKTVTLFNLKAEVEM